MAGHSVLAVLLVVGAPAVVASAGPSDSDRGGAAARAEWAGTWAAAVTRGNTVGLTNTGLNNQSIRMTVRTTVGGERLRVRLSNLYGEQAVQVGHATVARPNATTLTDRSDILPGTLRELKFGGSTSATMNKGAELLSDPLTYPVGEQEDLIVTLHFPVLTGPVTFHGQSKVTTFIGANDLTTAADGAGFTIRPDCCWMFLSGIDVLRPKSPGAVVVLSDSIGDANGSTVNANRRWPELLAGRLVAARPEVRTPGVLNLSLAGNRLNHEAPSPERVASPATTSWGRTRWPGSTRTSSRRPGRRPWSPTSVSTTSGCRTTPPTGSSPRSDRSTSRPRHAACAASPSPSPPTRGTATRGCGRRRRRPPGRR